MTHSDLSLKAASSAQNNDKEQVSQCSKGANGSVSAQQSSRLLSLDLLRGMDLALLVLFQPVVYEWVEASRPMQGSFGEALFGQITHVPWQGFCFWDIIMPLFMFMSGITIPFSMGKYQRGECADRGHFLLRLFRRFMVLWLLGMVAQGNLLALDLRQLHLYSNTLQSIAVGYVVVALLFVYTSWRTQLTVVASCMLAYVAVFAIWGQMDFTIDVNICEEIDRQGLGRWRDGVVWQGNQWLWEPTYHYTWILSSLNFVATVYMGCMAGMVLRSGLKNTSKLRILLFEGLLLIVLAFALSGVVPIIKHIWSTSMTFFSGGICLLLMGAAYYWVDLKGRTRGLMWLRFYGSNSLVAYMVGEHVSFSSITDSVFYGLKPLLGDYYSVLNAAVQGIIVLLVLRWMYKSNIFVKA